MILVDTNVLIALMVDGREAQRQAALVELTHQGAQGTNVVVCESVLVEACWVLERSYRLDREKVAEALRRLISTPPLTAWDPALADAALALMTHRPALALTDCLLLRRAADFGGCVLTFDDAVLRESRPDS